MMKAPKKLLVFAVPMLILVVLGGVSYSTATNWVALAAERPTVTKEVTVMPGAAIATAPTVIDCTLTNYSIRPVYYSAGFRMEKWVEEKWEEVPFPEGLKYTLGISVVWPFSSAKILYPTSPFTDGAGSGSYRIVQTVWAGNASNAKKHTLYCNFSVQ